MEPGGRLKKAAIFLLYSLLRGKVDFPLLEPVALWLHTQQKTTGVTKSGALVGLLPPTQNTRSQDGSLLESGHHADRCPSQAPS